MSVRKYQPAIDKKQALAILKWGATEQSKAISEDPNEQEGWYRDSIAKSFDDDAGEFIRPEDWWVAERDGAVIGVMRLMSESDGKVVRYGDEGLLVIQELD